MRGNEKHNRTAAPSLIPGAAHPGPVRSPCCSEKAVSCWSISPRKVTRIEESACARHLTCCDVAVLARTVRFRLPHRPMKQDSQPSHNINQVGVCSLNSPSIDLGHRCPRIYNLELVILIVGKVPGKDKMRGSATNFAHPHRATVRLLESSWGTDTVRTSPRRAAPLRMFT